MIRSSIRRLAMALVLGAAASWAHAQGAPDELVKRLSGEVLAAVKADKSLQGGNIDKVSALVDEKILPHTDFARMTASAVGPQWRSATPEQQKALTEQFKALLVRTYAGAFSQAANSTIEFAPMRAAPEDNDVTVRSLVRQPGTEAIQLDYRMSKGSGAWKIIDVNVLGIWLVQNYRTSFSQEVNRGGIDGLIKSLQSKNAELSAPQKK